MKIDFHAHSTASDGTLTPTELAVATQGFVASAITDHDNADGAEEFLAFRGGVGRRIAGIELSIDPGAGFDKFHLLGLGIDPKSVTLKAFLRKVLEGRNARNQRIFANFQRLGIDIKPEPHGEVLARPHFAKWLVEHGYAIDASDAFAKYLLPDSPASTSCYEERWHPSQSDAFEAVHKAGGICIMAHPKYWRRAWKDSGCDYALVARELKRLKDCGLDGIEAVYEANTAEETVEFVRLARQLGLLVSAGSDFHGAHKPNIHLGMEVEDAVAYPLLSRLGI